MTTRSSARSVVGATNRMSSTSTRCSGRSTSTSNKVEEKLSEQSGLPVALAQTQTLWRARRIVWGLAEEIEHRNRGWKHDGPRGHARDFILLVSGWLFERELGWSDLAAELHLPEATFSHIANIAPYLREDEGVE